MQNANQRTPEQRAALAVKRHRAHRIQRNVKDLILWMLKAFPECEHGAEQPTGCGSLHGQGELVPLKEQLCTTNCNGCAFGMTDKEGHPVLKPWRIATTSEPLAANLST